MVAIRNSFRELDAMNWSYLAMFAYNIRLTVFPNILSENHNQGLSSLRKIQTATLSIYYLRYSSSLIIRL